ncbi:mitochondrial import inner membrane translocase subunit TIM50-C-like isoform X2 [Adelges cooleyi]|uniref:mitochondrial import inner membrane translocase subunit TIM50-C-like isoform X2 n=1 Tax=Adelges cooleyi TaxID=133065 RepID=UPI00218003B4|nr:mitochondrial import inner membrane translocase subunit TIM50-C-like isoform X2 [Adelges cooleyi]
MTKSIGFLNRIFLVVSNSKYYRPPLDSPNSVSKYKNCGYHRFKSDIADHKAIKVKSTLKKWIILSSKAFAISLTALVGYGLSLLIYEDDDLITNVNKDVPFIIQMYEKLCFRIQFYHKMLTSPITATDKLLPDPLPDYYEKPQYTLVFEMIDLLVHPEWSYSTGWRYKKRSNINYFLEKVGKNFEVVVFTAENGNITHPILNELDPLGWICYRLSRQCADFQNGILLKNLDKINRDLKKVIVVDWNKNWTALQPNNTLIIPRWNGDENDNSLIDLADFLTTEFVNDIEDVRGVIKEYKQYDDDPIKFFREKQQSLKKHNGLY